MQPIILPDMDQLVAKFPPAAKADLVEWNPGITPAQFLARILHAEYDIQRDLNPDVSFQITDDRPLNEYYLLRQMLNVRK